MYNKTDKQLQAEYKLKRKDIATAILCQTLGLGRLYMGQYIVFGFFILAWIVFYPIALLRRGIDFILICMDIKEHNKLQRDILGI